MLPFFYTFYQFWKSIRSSLKDPEFEVLFTLLILILLSGMFFYHDIEGWGFLDSLYFSVTTLTTVGFGDFTPHTAIGKIFTMFYLFIGIGILFGFVNTIAQHALSQRDTSNLLSHRLGLRKRISSEDLTTGDDE